MYDECIATARNMLFHRYNQHYEGINSELKQLEYKRFSEKGFGSWYIKEFETICAKHLHNVAQFVFGVLEENFTGIGSWSPTLHEKLKVEFAAQLNQFFESVNGLLEIHKNDEGMGKAFRIVSFEHVRARLISDYYAQIDLLCRKLANESKANNPNMKIEISGGNNNVQVGNNNSQQIHSTIQFFETQIDKSSGTLEQKKEAKSLLGTMLNNPIIASILGSLAGAIVKS